MKYLLIACLALASTSANSQFRDTTWGNSKESVKKSEKLNYLGNQELNGMDFILYNGTVSGIDAQIGYFFIEDELVRGIYVFTEVYASGGQYLQDYQKVKNLLTTLYGKPTEEIEIGIMKQLKNTPIK